MGKELTVHDIESKITERMEYLDSKETKHFGDDIRLRELKHLLDWILCGDEFQ